ncbi:hypothetical protein GIW59_26630, partial [Pseudomonas gessardii]
MSYMSVNTPLSTKLANHPLDLPTPLPSALGGGDASKVLDKKQSALPEYSRNVDTGREGAVGNTDALSKLLDMFELLFKAMRDILSGKKHPPELQPSPDKSSEAKPSLGGMPLTPSKETKVALETDKPLQKKLEADGKPAVSGNDLKMLLDANKPLQKKLEADSKPTTPGNDLKVPLEAAKPLTNKLEADGKPAIPGNDLKGLLDAGKQPVVIPQIKVLPGTDSKVESDASVRVNVDVKVNNCHCPGHDHPTVPGIDVKLKPGPDGQVRPGVEIKPTVVPGPDGQVRPGVEIKPTVVPGPDGQVRPGVEIKPTVVPGPDGQVRPGVEIKPTVVPGPDGQVRPGV